MPLHPSDIPLSPANVGKKVLNDENTTAAEENPMQVNTRALCSRTYASGVAGENSSLASSAFVLSTESVFCLPNKIHTTAMKA